MEFVAIMPLTSRRARQRPQSSITDCGKLLSAIKSFMSGKLEQGAAIDVYETVLKVQGGEEVKLSEINTWMLYDWAKVLESPLSTAGLTANKK
jgi:hypothetical protein